MDDLKVFRDLIQPNEIKEVHMDEEGSDKSFPEEERCDSRRDMNSRDGDVSNNEVSTNEDDPKQSSDVEKNFQFDEDDTKFGMEQLGTLLSAFFQDDSGRNVVDAIVQNSKWQRNICRALEKISYQLENKNQ